MSRGRPKLPDDRAKRFPLSARTTLALKERMSQAAHQSGRSLAQEIELRLERSFRDERNAAVAESWIPFLANRIDRLERENARYLGIVKECLRLARTTPPCDIADAMLGAILDSVAGQ